MSPGLLPLAVIAVVLLAGHALAADGGHEAAHHGPDWFLLLLQLFNVAVLGFILFRYARKPLNDFLKQRSMDIRNRIESAERGLASAEQELATLRGRLGQMEVEKRAFVAEAANAANAEAERHLERASESSIRIQEDARRVANQEIARARLELQAEAAALATKLAGEMLAEKLTPEDDRRMLSEFIERVGSQS